MSWAYGATVGGGSTGTLGDEAGSGVAVPPDGRLRLAQVADAQPQAAADADHGASSKTPRTRARTGTGYEHARPAPTCLPDGPQVELAA